MWRLKPLVGMGCRGLRVRRPTPPSPAMASAPAAEAFPNTPTAEPEALARKQRLVLDKAYRYLLDQGFGVLELASLDLDEVPAMARQLADELAIPLRGLARGRAVLLAARGAAGS